MKNLMLIMVALVTLNVSAQPKHENRPERPHKSDAFLKDLTPEELADLKTKRMTIDLDLNASQQKQIRAIVLEEATFKQKQREEHSAKKGKGDNEKPSKEERLALMHEKLDREIAMKQQMKTILSEDQYKKWEVISERNSKRKRTRKHKERRSN